MDIKKIKLTPTVGNIFKLVFLGFIYLALLFGNVIATVFFAHLMYGYINGLGMSLDIGSFLQSVMMVVATASFYFAGIAGLESATAKIASSLFIRLEEKP